MNAQFVDKFILPDTPKRKPNSYNTNNDNNDNNNNNNTITDILYGDEEEYSNDNKWKRWFIRSNRVYIEIHACM